MPTSGSPSGAPRARASADEAGGDVEIELWAGTVVLVTSSPDRSYQPTSASRFRSTTRRLLGGVVVTGALLVAGCGGGSTTAADGDSAASAARSEGGAPLAAEAAASIDLKVVADGSEVALGDVAAGDRPTLLWFWAPF